MVFFSLSIEMKNVRSKTCLLPPMYLSAHFQEAWPHPGHRLAGEQRLTEHIRWRWSPRLGGLLLSLWLNSQAGRAGATPNDSWVLKSHTRPHRGPVLPPIPASHSSPQSWAHSPHSSVHWQQWPQRATCVQSAAVVKNPSPALRGAETVSSHTEALSSLLSATRVLLGHRREMLLEKPAFMDVHIDFQRTLFPKNWPLTCCSKDLNLACSLLRFARYLLNNHMFRTCISYFKHSHADTNTSGVVTAATSRDRESWVLLCVLGNTQSKSQPKQ